MSEFSLIIKDNIAETRDLRINEIYDVVIIGAGPSGLTAAIYAGRSKLKTVVFEKITAGGQIAVSEWVENYPGFPDGISGHDLIEKFKRQAEKFSGQIVLDEVLGIRKESDIFYIKVANGEIKAKAVIVSTGKSPVPLPVPEEQTFRGKGISYCVTCDAAFFVDKIVAVVGGGDTALHDVIHLTKFASKILLVHRRNELRAAKMLQEKALSNPKLEMRLNSTILHVLGDRKVKAIEIENVETNNKEIINLDGIFVAIGEKPNNEIVKDLVLLNESGFIKTNPNMETSLSGLLAVGDVRDTSLRQVITSCADGAIAAYNAEKYIKNLER
jgi:thioredoxin reductase (NADPH)